MKIPLGGWVLAIVVAISLVIGGQYPTESGVIVGGYFLPALLGDPSVPAFTHALLALPVLGLLSYALVRRQVVQVPTPSVSIAILVLASLLCASVLYSLHRGVSLGLLPEWLTYFAAIYAAVATVGRRAGPKAVLVGAFVGGCIVALRGVREYSEVKGTDPNWRIFAGWINPNAAATALAIAFLCGLTLVLTEDRVKSLLAGVFTAVAGMALLLTQSKGGLLSTAAGTLLLFVGALLWSEARGKSVARLVATVALTGVMVFAVMPRGASGPGGGGGGGIQRLEHPGESTDQSVGFRKNLYKGEIEMMRANPVGYGLGAYRFESARSGLTTQTVLGHNVYLQLGTEASVLAPIVLIGLGGIWVWLLFQGSRTQPSEVRMLKMGFVAVILAVAGHSLVDSDLYYFGAGLPFFAFLGVGLLLASDGVTPEYTPRGPRLAGAGALAIVALLGLATGIAEAQRAQARAALAMGDGAAADGFARAAASVWPLDGESSYLLSQTVPDNARRIVLLQEAVAKSPSARNLRALARTQAEAGDNFNALSNLNRALAHDPNNLPALWQMVEIYRRTGDKDAASRAAQRLVEIEPSPYFAVRSLPDLIPTETYRARVYLASVTDDPALAVNLLKPAIAGFQAYADHTIPQIKQVEQSTPGGKYGGESMASARETMQLAADAARELTKDQRTAGDKAGALESEAAAARFATLPK